MAPFHAAPERRVASQSARKVEPTSLDSSAASRVTAHAAAAIPGRVFGPGVASRADAAAHAGGGQASLRRFPIKTRMSIATANPSFPEKQLAGDSLRGPLRKALEGVRRGDPIAAFGATKKTLKDRPENSLQGFHMGGIPLQMGANNYVAVGDQQVTTRLQQDTGLTWSSSGPAYGEIRQLVESFVKPDDPGAVGRGQELARRVRSAIRESGKDQASGGSLAANSNRDVIAALIAGVMGVAESVRNPYSIAMLLMFLDLVESGESDWVEGLGPKDTDRNSPSVQERADYFQLGDGREASETELKRRLKAFADTHFPNEGSEVRKRILGEGNIKSISALGGSVPMVGAETASAVEKSDYQVLVTKKEETMMIRWVQRRYAGFSQRMRQWETFWREGPPQPGGAEPDSDEQQDWSDLQNNKEDQVFTKWFSELLQLR